MSERIINAILNGAKQIVESIERLCPVANKNEAEENYLKNVGDLLRNSDNYEKPYSCFVCGTGYSLKGSAYKCIIKCKDAIIEEMRKDEKKDEGYSTKFNCFYCHKEYSNYRAYEKCQERCKNFIKEYKVHPYQCPICHVKYDGYFHWQDCFAKCSKSRKVYKCNFCGSEHTSERYADICFTACKKSHVNSYPDGFHYCKYCGLKYDNIGNAINCAKVCKVLEEKGK